MLLSLAVLELLDWAHMKPRSTTMPPQLEHPKLLSQSTNRQLKN
jgi:hypothetical protein